MPAVLAPPPLAALRLMTAEPERLARLPANTARVRVGLSQLGYHLLGGAGPIVPVLIGDDDRTRARGSYLLRKGMYVPSMAFPVVPKGEARLRAQVSASHTDEQIDGALMLFDEARAA